MAKHAANQIGFMGYSANNRIINAENDNDVSNTPNPWDEQSAVHIGRAFRSGHHSKSHALRFAAWLVSVADSSPGHEDFLATLEAVERENS